MRIRDFIIVPDADFPTERRLNPMIALPVAALVGLTMWYGLYKLITLIF